MVLETRPAAVKGERGYLLPHHGLLALALSPGSIPRFVGAYDAGPRLIESGRVAAPERDRGWARLADQGGFDEASGCAS